MLAPGGGICGMNEMSRPSLRRIGDVHQRWLTQRRQDARAQREGRWGGKDLLESITQRVELAGNRCSQRKCQLAAWCIGRHLSCMKTASVQQLPQQWPEILRWVAAGEEVQVTQQDKVIAKVVPASPAPRPDFLARAKAIWGEQPPGKPLSELVLEARGGEP